VRYLVSFSILSHVALWSLGFTAQAPYTPKSGTAERKQITDALRSVVEKELAKPVIFRIDALKVQGGWAFLRGAPLQKSGKKMDYRDTPYQKRIEAGTFDDWICALLNRDGKQWRVVEHVIGATDVPFVDWAERHHAPAAIFK
jgi:hypothetical protein